MPRPTTKAVHCNVPRVTTISSSVLDAALAASSLTSPIHSAAVFDLAQRAFCAAAILARPATLNPRHFVVLASKCAGVKLVALLVPDLAGGRPGLRFAGVRLDV
jgi:hypothetical protein